MSGQSEAAAGGGEDLAKDDHGDISINPTTKVEAEKVSLQNLGEEHLDKIIKLRAWIQNSRKQESRRQIVFFELREERNCFILVEALVKKPLEPVESCRVSEYELHLTKCYLIATGPEVLGMTLGAANKAVASFEDEDASEPPPTEAVKDLTVTDPAGAPAASMSTHLNNPAMHKRASVQQAIADIRLTMRKLFAEYSEARDFVQFQPPCLIGAASEGGADVFQLPYFDQTAYLAQSPQFYKQFESLVTGQAKKSNTPRHMTEFTGLDMEMEIEDSYTEVLERIEGLILYIFPGLKDKRAEEIELVRAVYPSEEFLLPEPRKEVCPTFAEEGPEQYHNVSDVENVSTPQEKALGALIRKKFDTDFYDPENPNVTTTYDFFMRGQNILSATLRRKGVDPASSGIKEYVDIFRSETDLFLPFSGGGIGLDRVVAWYLSLPSAHLASYHLRTAKRLLS
ncbi:hypothetical protein BJ170DRAFT_703251 [Xylariales sp. AK1849]|nr:hypothetical protein BJ170DRAFT_703251 [Xylariales sp. AK1849]